MGEAASLSRSSYTGRKQGTQPGRSLSEAETAVSAKALRQGGTWRV